MDQFRQELKGHSGSKVYLYENENGLFVRKIFGVQRNHERMTALRGIANLPKIYNYDGVTLDMEYIPGLDMRNYLLRHPVEPLAEFILAFLQMCDTGGYNIGHMTSCYEDSLYWLDTHPPEFPFTKKELIARLPKYLPCGIYHGDMTLENIIYGNDGRFYFIDPVHTPYCSFVYDLAKIRQDLDCHWFLRHKPTPSIIPKLIKLKELVFHDYEDYHQDELLIAMLLRNYRHSEKDSIEYKLIMREVWNRWK